MTAATSTVLVIQARSGSTRLPGKVLMEVGGRPMLRYQLDRLSHLTRVRVVVATSTLDRDDAVAAVAADAGVECVRGSETDVLARFGTVIDRFDPTTVVRLTGDCPLTDPAVVMEVLGHHHRHGDAYTSNVLPRTFPRGLDVEVAMTAALRIAIAEAADPAEREHVMPFLYRRPARFQLGNLDSGQTVGHGSWVVDTASDLRVVRHIVDHFSPSIDFGWREILAAFPVAPEPIDGLRFRRAVTRDSEALLALRNDPESVRWSGTGQPVGAVEHAAWFARHRDNPATRIWVMTEGGQDVGQLRIDIDDGIGTVSIGITPEARGRGLAGRALARLQEILVGDMQVSALHARIHPDHERSRNAFIGAGFATAGEVDGFTLYEWLQLPRSPGREQA